jgi:hypothetical protein
VGDFEVRLKRLDALLYGPTRRTTAAAERQERRSEVARLYLLWTMGEAERPEDLDPEEERLWRLMESYEEAHERVVDRVASKS